MAPVVAMSPHWVHSLSLRWHRRRVVTTGVLGCEPVGVTPPVASHRYRVGHSTRCSQFTGCRRCRGGWSVARSNDLLLRGLSLILLRSSSHKRLLLCSAI